MRISSHGGTDIGLRRAENEDAFFSDAAAQVWAVADGLGGLPAGALASKLAIQSLRERLGRGETFDDDSVAAWIEQINGFVQKAGTIHGGGHGIGTTFTLARRAGDELIIGHVGDSAVLRIRHGEITPLTPEHTVATMKQQRGIEPEPRDEHILTMCLGQPLPVEPCVLTTRLTAGDRYLLCTDGITKPLSRETIYHTVIEAPTAAPCVEELIAAANAAGGPDNATVVAVYVD